MESKRTLKIAAAIILLVGAATSYYLLTRGHDEVEAADVRSEWFCTACQKPFELGAAESKDRIHAEQRGEAESNPNEPRPFGRGETQVVSIAKCPFCQQWKGEAARKCPDCGEIFRARTGKNQVAICPHCQWDPKTGSKAEPSRIDEGVDH